jgi:uncharacterized protein (DUF427 family)
MLQGRDLQGGLPMSPLSPTTSAAGSQDKVHRLLFEPCAKRVRVMANGRTIADSLAVGLLLESGHLPVYYFPREDVRQELLKRSDHRTDDPSKGEAAYWTITAGGRRIEDAVWSYEAPPEQAKLLAGYMAFHWRKVDHWFEEDEEIFGHPRDPYHRVDVVPSSRSVRVIVGGEAVAETGRALFLFETGHPVRFYIPREDVRPDFLTPSRTVSTCPYKGQASYWSVEAGGRVVKDAAWSYEHPLPECPRIKGYLSFYRDRVDRIVIEGEPDPE